MDGKVSLCKILNSLLELERPIKREILIDFLLGHESAAIKKKGLDILENYACGDNKEEEHWTEVIDQALEAGYIKVKADGIGIMAKGKKYLVKPTRFELKSEDDEMNFAKDENDDLLDKMVEDAVLDGTTQSAKAVSTHRKLAIIQAIDRKVALDEFASLQGLDFEEVLADVESLLSTGTHLDLTYFAKEVLGDECIEELMNYFDSAATDSMDNAMNEYGDVYSYLELRLARVLWRSKRSPQPKSKKNNP